MRGNSPFEWACLGGNAEVSGITLHRRDMVGTKEKGRLDLRGAGGKDDRLERIHDYLFRSRPYGRPARPID